MSGVGDVKGVGRARSGGCERGAGHFGILRLGMGAACVPGTCARRSSQSWSAAPARFRFCGPRGPGRIEFGTNHGTAIEYVLMRARVSARVRE